MADGQKAIHPVMLGTAGHIDHGKSSLVRALTGIDPDRLKEEKERGLTIDLGFARLQLRDGRVLGMIDVPGHERFVRNMVAGSTALDLALLVVAADDGVMPQTLEHLDILDLLGVSRGVVALTKVDLVDEDVATLAEAEIEELLSATALAGAPILRVSSTTGAGLEELRTALEDLALQTVPRATDGPFRMPIQRVFRLKGIGTVVTGVALSGVIEPGATVEFLPGGASSKVRAIEAFGGSVGRAVAGHSAALSVPDVKAGELARGMVAAAAGIFRAGEAVDIQLALLPRSSAIGHRRDIRFHTGTAEVQGMLLLLDRDKLAGGEEAVARVLLDEPISCAPGDRFLLRLQNPVATVGGGVVLRLEPSPRRYRRRSVGEELQRIQAAGPDADRRVIEELRLAGPAGRSPGELAAVLAVDAATVEQALGESTEVHIHPRTGRAFTTATLAEGIDEIEQAVARMLRSKPLAASVKRANFRPDRRLPAALLDAVIDALEARGKVRKGTAGQLLFTDRLKPLGPDDRRRLERLVAACESKGVRPPTRAELVAELGEAEAALDGLLARALDEAQLEIVGDHVYGAVTLRQVLRAIRRNCLAHGGELAIPALRDELQTSRKFLIPLLEFVDGLGLTRLRGGVRVLLESSALSQELGQESA
ncbi:MAG: selenocysteine-specific translation elongation factor [Planctomycetota bacterium]